MKDIEKKLPLGKLMNARGPSGRRPLKCHCISRTFTILKGTRLETSLDEWKWGMEETDKGLQRSHKSQGKMNLTPALPLEH